MYFLLFLAVVIVPGWLLCSLPGVQRWPLLVCVPISYAVVIVFLIVGRWLGLEVGLLVYVFITFTFIIGVINFLVRDTTLILGPMSGTYNKVFIYIAGFVVLTVVFIVYFFLVDYYDEVPADLFRHLEMTEIAYNDYLDGVLRPVDNIAVLLGKSGRYWHYLHGLLTHLGDVKFVESYRYAVFINGLILLTAIYLLALQVFRSFLSTTDAQIGVALIICLLFFLHFGVNVFSFIRYYSFAPTALNFVVYFAAVSILIHFTAARGMPIRYLLVLAVCIFVAAMVHVQEAVFIAIIGLLMLAYVVLARRFGFAGEALTVSEDESSDFYFRRSGFDRMIPYGWLVIAGLVILIAGFLWSHYFVASSTPRPDNKLIFLGSIIPALKGWYVLNPTYQFFRVVTPWGLLVYVLFFWHWKDFRDNPFLVAGMLSPLFTVFNPLFVDLFLRHTTYITLWRFCYMIPLVFVAGYLFYKAFTRFRGSTVVGKVGYGLMVFGLVALLFPIQFGSFTVPYSRMQTLMPVKKENSPEHWADLLNYLRTLPNRELILTDPVTGYFVSALTKHHSPRYKFFKLRYKQFNFDSYENKPLAKYKNWLIIVNLRDGGYSKTGELSRHWPADILKVSRRYKPELIAHLEENPDRFEELWSVEDIKVYRILE